ncbi:MAG TPA: SAM-dependent methyltransferase [Azospirillaceae bacterium]|nr:SAM-dependent methyltransferase [Azospirillaceae bacterium]
MPDISTRAEPTSIVAAGGGSLTIVGTGIQAVAHLTREAIGHIRHADVVFHSIKDPVAAADIHAINPNAIDLTVLYGTEKRRRLTYMQMAAAMLREVRAGRRVTGVFYGHPGFYVAPARIALATARQEGFETRLLAGISSVDLLFADLRIDPSQVGYQVLEATDFLLRDRPLVTSGHVVLMQVGPVGDLYRPSTDNLERRGILFERLIALYGPSHPCVHYIGAPRPGQKPELRRLPLSAYRDPANLRRLNKASTLYIPPRDTRATDAAMAARLGIADLRGAPVPAAEPPAPDLGPVVRPAISVAFFRVMSEIVNDPAAAAEFRADPAGFAARFGLVGADEARWLDGLARRGDPAGIATAPLTRAASAEELHDAPEELHDAPEELHDAPEELHDAPEELHDAPEELHDTPEELHDSPEELHDSPEELHDSPEELHDSPEELHDTPEELHDDPEELHDTPEELHDAPDVR